MFYITGATFGKEIEYVITVQIYLPPYKTRANYFYTDWNFYYTSATQGDPLLGWITCFKILNTMLYVESVFT